MEATKQGNTASVARALADPSASSEAAASAIPNPASDSPGSGRRESLHAGEAPHGAGSSEADSRLRAAGPGESGGVAVAPEEPRHTLNELLDKAAAGGAAPDILQEIGRRFTKARMLSKPESWRQLQADLMHNSHLLCPAIMGYKDLLTSVREIEDFMKGSVGQVGRSNEELLAEFLRGEGQLAAEVAPADSQLANEASALTESAIVPVDSPIPNGTHDSH